MTTGLGENGFIAFIGKVNGKAGTFYGVQLDRAGGKNNGTVDGTRYFSCPESHGVFVREENIQVKKSSNELNDKYMEDFHGALASMGVAPPHESSDERIGRFKHDDFLGSFSGKNCDSTGNWNSGPKNPQGMLCDVSDRPLLCSSVSSTGQEVVLGGSDHSLRIYDVNSGKLKRQLYSKRFGHSEWVTCCSYCPDGTVISGGMDSKLCIWRGVQSLDLEGHRGSVSKVIVTSKGGHAISCSYDKTVRIWNLRSKIESACMTGHKAPILEMGMSNGGLITGSRDGQLLFWDLVRCKMTQRSEEHDGHVTALHCDDNGLIVSGDQSGTMRLWDSRTGGSIHAACIHPGGAVNCIKSHGGTIVSAGADRMLNILDERKMDQVLKQIDSHKDYIYSLNVSDCHIFSGSGDGMVLVHDIQTGTLNYGLGANRAGVRCIELTYRNMITAGDDGTAMVYQF